MIKAKITVFDDETGVVYDEDRILRPYCEEHFSLCTKYQFVFLFSLADPKACLNAIREAEALRKRKEDESEEQA